MRIKKNDPYTGLPWPVQRWTQVWDKRSKFGDFYNVLFDHFVMKILTRLGVVSPRLPKEIIKVLRIKSYMTNGFVYSKGAFTHNFGDLFSYENCTIIRIYGCEQGPHVLPIIVSPRLEFLEFIWKMMWMEREQISSDRKGNFIPRVTIFNDFSVGCETLEKVHNFLVKNYVMRVAQATHFDPKGCINDIRVKKLKESE